MEVMRKGCAPRGVVLRCVRSPRGSIEQRGIMWTEFLTAGRDCFGLQHIIRQFDKSSPTTWVPLSWFTLTRFSQALAVVKFKLFDSTPKCKEMGIT